MRDAQAAAGHAKWPMGARSGAVTGRRGYPPRLRNGSPRRQVVTLWYPPRTIEYGSRFPGKAAGRGVTRGWCPFERLSRWPSSGAVSSPVSAPLVVAPALARVDTPRTYTLHTTTTCTCTSSLVLPRARHRAPLAIARLRPLRSPPPPPPHALAPSPPGACASCVPCPHPPAPPAPSLTAPPPRGLAPTDVDRRIGLPWLHRIARRRHRR